MMEALKRDSKTRKAKVEYAKLEADLEAQVTAGKLTREQAEQRLRDARVRMFPDRSKTAQDDIEDRMKRSRYAEYAEDIERKVAAGALTREKADALLKKTREEMFGSPSDSRGRTDGESDEELQRSLRARYAKYADDIERKVAAGELTREQADALLEKQREEIFSSPSESRGRPDGESDEELQRSLRARYAKYADDIERKVSAGELTREKADALLEEKREEMFGSPSESRGRTDGESDEDLQRSLRARYAKYAEGIERKVAAGELTREQADALLEEKREEMFGPEEESRSRTGAGSNEGA